MGVPHHDVGDLLGGECPAEVPGQRGERLQAVALDDAGGDVDAGRHERGDGPVLDDRDELEIDGDGVLVVHVDDDVGPRGMALLGAGRSEELTSELQSLMRNSYAALCLKKQKKKQR